MNTIYCGIQHRHTSVPGAVPTVPSADPELSTDLFDSELFINTADKKVYFRAGTTIEDLNPKAGKGYTYIGTTPSNTIQELFIGGITNSRISLINNTAYRYEFTAIGINPSGQVASYKGNGVAKQVDTVSSLSLNTVTEELDEMTITGVTVAVDAYLDVLEFKVTGQTDVVIKWKIFVTITEIGI